MANIKYTEYGTVVTKKQGVILADGLANCIYGQLVDLGGGSKGIVIGYNEKFAQILVLKEKGPINSGDRISSTMEPLSIGVGKNYIGRVVTALGEPRDQGSPIVPDDHFPIFRDSPPIMVRGPVEFPLETGIKILDSMIPIGRGQRELITGDRMSGKTTVVTDAIINQKGKGTVCIYVDIGKSESSLKRVTSLFQKHGCFEYTIVVSAGASATQGEQYLAPYVACALGEYFMYKGGHVLVCFDDFSKHAWAYREVSLLLGRPPGRNAYPGDIFYLHSQMIERAAQLDEKRGGGSMTFLPLMETLEGDITSYVITNVISMTDGQIVLDLNLFNMGFKPSLHIGLSVSRIGTKAQWPILRGLTKSYRLDYLQHQELVESTKLQTDIPNDVMDQLKYGRIFSEIITQEQDSPVPFDEQVFLYVAHNEKMLMPYSMDQVKEFKRDICEFIRAECPDLLKQIREVKKMTPEIKEGILKYLNKFFQRFIVTEDHSKVKAAAPQKVKPAKRK